MKIIVNYSRSRGEVLIPASKSDLHRAIFAASLANGTSVIKNITLSNDINATIDAFKALGANIIQKDDTLIINGISDFNSSINKVIDCGESGTTLRFLLPLVGLFNNEIKLTGAKSLFSRPLSVYEDILKKQNIEYNLSEDSFSYKESIKEGEFILKGDISSQFISGLLFYLPLLNKDSYIKVLPPFESESYVNMTLKTLKEFGIQINRISRHEFVIPGNQKYISKEYTVEGDYSQFAFYAVLGAINNDVTCIGLNKDSIQGDRIILDILKSFNINYTIEGDKITVHKQMLIKGNVINLEDCPDLGPICMVLSLFSLTPVRITNIKRLRLKESNRVDSMVDNLRKLRANIEVKENEMIIYPRILTPTKEVLDSHNDHRIMMSLVVLGSKLLGLTRISDPHCIKKSYVNFYKDIQELGIEVGLYD